MYNETILIVEDDLQIQNFIGYTLEEAGYFVIKTAKGAEAVRLAAAEPVDMMLLDMGLPDFDGIEVLHQVREWSQMPVIIVSARDQDQEKVEALDMGADDYLTKPFSARELLARIRLALRHYYRMAGNGGEDILVNRELRLDRNRHMVFRGEEEIHLTKLEYDLLALFMENQGKVLTYGSILKALYGKNYGSDTQALRALMAGLRRKLEKNTAKPEYIKTEIGIGYRMTEG
ncbi:MAG: response regulator transcription factor [Roseburia sp.]|nr:response regulator transcription factor [Roseburia sp.]